MDVSPSPVELGLSAKMMLLFRIKRRYICLFDKTTSITQQETAQPGKRPNKCLDAQFKSNKIYFIDKLYLQQINFCHKAHNIYTGIVLRKSVNHFIYI